MFRKEKQSDFMKILTKDHFEGIRKASIYSYVKGYYSYRYMTFYSLRSGLYEQANMGD
jgi:hypothetical protein